MESGPLLADIVIDMVPVAESDLSSQFEGFVIRSAIRCVLHLREMAASESASVIIEALTEAGTRVV